jgi:hypothetical protein
LGRNGLRPVRDAAGPTSWRRTPTIQPAWTSFAAFGGSSWLFPASSGDQPVRFGGSGVIGARRGDDGLIPIVVDRTALIVSWQDAQPTSDN